MIKGVHTMFYSSKAEELRKFLSTKLGLKSNDIGDGWLIFDLPEADMGCHPSGDDAGHGQRTGTHEISFYCDNIYDTVKELKEKGVEFTQEIEDYGFGLVTYFKVPGDFQIQLYESKYHKQ